MKSLGPFGKVIAALGALVVVVAVALAVVVWRFDADWAKGRLAQAVQEGTQRTLRIEGDLGLAFYPSLGLKLGPTSLSEPASEQEFASVGSAHVSVRLRPLLARQIVVDRLELDGLRARIIRDKNGALNIDDLIGRSKSRPDTPPPEAKGKAVDLDIAGVAISRSAVEWVDEKEGRTLRLSDVNLRTGRVAQQANGPLELAFRAASDQPRVDAAFKLAGQYRWDVAQQRYAVEKPRLGVQGELPGLREANVALTAADAAYAATGGGLQVQGLAATLKGLFGEDTLDARVDVPQLALAGTRVSAGASTANVRLGGAQRQLEAAVKASGVQGDTAQLAIPQLEARWNLRQEALATSGTTTGPVQVDLARQRVVLPTLTGEMQIAHPSLPMKQLQLPLQAAVDADWGRSQARGKLSTRIEQSAVQASFDVDQFSPLAAGFDLAIDHLDLDRYLPASAPATPASGAAPAPKAPAPAAKEAPLDLAFLRGPALRGRTRIGTLKAFDMQLSQVDASLKLAGGRLDLQPLSARLYGGTLAGAATLQADGNRVAVRQTLDNVAIGPLLRDALKKDLLEGRGRMALDVTTVAGATDAMKRSLNGTASLSLRDGALKGINLASALRQAKAKIKAIEQGGSQESVVEARQTERTDFSEMTASFRIAQGVARNDDLQAKSPFLRATGAGTIDLVREQLDYRTEVTVVASSKGQEGKDLEELRGLTIPVRLTGPLASPSYRLEFGAMAAALAKQQVRERVQRELDERLGDRLGGQKDLRNLGDVLRGLKR